MPNESAHTVVWAMAKRLHKKYQSLQNSGTDWADLSNVIRERWFQVAVEALTIVAEGTEEANTRYGESEPNDLIDF